MGCHTSASGYRAWWKLLKINPRTGITLNNLLDVITLNPYITPYKTIRTQFMFGSPDTNSKGAKDKVSPNLKP